MARNDDEEETVNISGCMEELVQRAKVIKSRASSVSDTVCFPSSAGHVRGSIFT